MATAIINDRVPIPGWLGGANPLRSLAADSEDTINLYPELNGPSARSQVTLYGVPGLTVMSQAASVTGPLPGGPNVGIVSYSYQGADRSFAVSGSTLFEVFQDGSYIPRGSLSINQPAHWAFNTFQVEIATGLALYCFDLSTNVLIAISQTIYNADGSKSPGDPIAAQDVEFIDGYLFALSVPYTILASKLYHGELWDPLDSLVRGGASDPFVGLAADHLQLYGFGSETIEVYWDAGNPAGFPFSRVQSGFIQRGLASPSTVIEMSDGLFWVGRMVGGGPVVYRNQGYSAVRISTHAVEAALESYGDVTEAISSYYVEGGHEYFLCHFPSANSGLGETWGYDTTTSLWHKRLFWNQNLGQWSADPARYITYAWGQQIVADYRNGNICLQSLSTQTSLDENGNTAPRRCLRRSPPIQRTMNWNVFHEFLLELQTGIDLPISGPGSIPLAALRFSDDGGYTWSNEIVVELGQTGQTTWRAMWRRLGKSRDRVFEVVITDPIPIAITNAFMRMSPGSGA
jgi:hypothetical protein